MKRKKKNSILFLFPFVPFSPLIIYSHSISSPFLSLSHIIYSYAHGKEEKHFMIVLVLYLPVKSLDRALGMSDREEKKSMATPYEISWRLRNKDIHIPLGPYGATNGTSWDDGYHQRIESIFVSYSGYYIRSIRTVYKNFDHNIFVPPQRGSMSLANTSEAIHLPPETPITRIDGYYDTNGITCLKLSTNNGQIGSFGIKDGSPFMFQDPRGFTGFHGRSDDYRLSALGVYVNCSTTKYK